MEGNGSALAAGQIVIGFLGILSAPLCNPICEGELVKEVSSSRGVRIFCFPYKRLEEVTKITWLFFLSEVVSAQVLGQEDSHIPLHLVLPRSATP